MFSSKYLKYTLWFIFVVVIGALAAQVIARGSKELYSYVANRIEARTVQVDAISPEAAVPEFSPRGPDSFKVIWQNVSDFAFKPLAQGKTIRANLKTMKLYLYEDGILLHTFTISGKAKKGSYWETPGGEYKVVAKETDHYSPNAKLWMPYSVQFFGSYFIHGWPYDSNGRDVKAGNQAGSIRLKNEDAKIVYDFADTNTVVSVYSDLERPPSSVGSDYFIKDPAKKLKLSAKSYLVADVETGEIILQKNIDQKWPIASTTKLLTALTSYDVVDQNQITTISKQAVNTYGFNGAFHAGERIKTADLVYPLLLESSNDSGEIIAEHVGRRFFMEAMNKKAKTIGMRSSSFEDPSGLSPNNISTAKDMFTLAKYIYENKPEIYSITKQETIPRSGHLWHNKGQFHRYAGYVGGKTGFTNPAKHTLISVFEIPLSEFATRKISIIILQSDSRPQDVQEIFNYLKSNVYYGQKELAPLPLQYDEEFDDQEGAVEQKISLGFVGDIMLDRGVKTSVEKNFNGEYARLFDNLGFLKNYDILFGNLEGPVSDKGNNVGSKFSFRMDPKVLDVLKDAGFDTLSFANNHVGDWNKAAFLDTLARLEEKGLNPVGAGKNKRDAEDVRIIEVNGTKIGYLGFSDVGPDWLAATDANAGILLGKDKNLVNIIKNADPKVDVLVVSFHWGEEYQKHSARQEMLAHQAIDAGAEIVAGGHPHVMQDIEKYHNGIIAYSLGNFIFDQYFSTDTMQGMLLEVDIVNKKLGGYTKKVIKLNKFFQPESVTVSQ